MHGFSTVDGFVEITESLAEMIKYIANEPSVGLFYVQQHAQNAVPNVVNLRNNVVEKSRETILHTENMEDSITMARSMKQCGLPIANEMIKDIRQSLAIMSTKQPKRGLISSPSLGFQMARSSSSGPASWGHNGVDSQQESKKMSNYFSTVFKSAKERASNFKWPQLDLKESTATQGEKLPSHPNPSKLIISAAAAAPSSQPDKEADELPLSSRTADEVIVDEEEPTDVELPPHKILISEYYEDFKADKEAKLEEWLGGTGDNQDTLQETE